MTGPRPTRRIVFQGLGALGVAAVLAGCGGDDEGGDPPASGTALAATSEVPVGGGLIVDGVVITQPTEGTFEAFSAVCTHQSSVLSAVGDEGIECPLHGSRFSITDGSPTRGPATESLPRVTVEVKDGDIVLA